MSKSSYVVLAIGLSAAVLAAAGNKSPLPAQADKPARSISFLTSDVDLYCSFFILEDLPTLKILGGDGSRTLFSDGDLIYFKRSSLDTPVEGQVMSVLELGPAVPGSGRKSSPGSLAFQRGRVRVLRSENELGTARVERTCGLLMPGQFLVPFLEKTKMQVKDVGFAGRVWTGAAGSGQVIFLEDNSVQISTSQRALIDLGRDAGLELGSQLTVFVKASKDVPYEPTANVVVIDVGRATATVKVLTAKAPVGVGDLVQVK